MRLNRHDQDVAWRELARRFGVSDDVARALFARAESDAQGDAKQAEWNFRRLLAETQGVDALALDLEGLESSSSADIGKWTRVLFEGQPSAPTGSPTGQSPADRLKSALESALQNGERAWKSIVAGDAKSVVAALHKLKAGQLGGVLGVLDADKLTQILRLADALITIVGQDKPPANGKQLPSHLQSALQDRLGADVSDVRVHDDADAAAAARRHDAIAFAEGTNVFFSDGAYDPSSERGQALIAHEVAHVAQQRNSDRAERGALSAPGSAVEREADRFATAFAAGTSPGAPAFKITERAAAGTISRTTDPAAAPAAATPKEWKPKLVGQILDLSSKLAGARDQGDGSKVIDINQNIGPVKVTYATFRATGDKIDSGVIHAKIDQGKYQGTEGTLAVDNQARVSGTLTVPMTATGLFTKEVQVTVDSDKITGTATLSPQNFIAPDFPIQTTDFTLGVVNQGTNLSVTLTGSAEVTIANGIANGHAKMDVLLHADNSGLTFDATINGNIDILGLASAAATITYNGQKIELTGGGTVPINLPGLQGIANIHFAQGKLSLDSSNLHLTMPNLAAVNFKDVKAEASKLEGRLELASPIHIPLPGGASIDLEHTSIAVAQGIAAGDIKGKFDLGSGIGLHGEVDLAYQRGDGGITGHVTIAGGTQFTVGGVTVKIEQGSQLTVDREVGVAGDITGSVKIPGLPDIGVHVIAAKGQPIDLTCDAHIPLNSVVSQLGGDLHVTYHRGGGANAFDFKATDVSVNAGPIHNQVIFEELSAHVEGGQLTGSLTAKSGTVINADGITVTINGGRINLLPNKILDGHLTATTEAAGAAVQATVGWKQGVFDWAAEGSFDLAPLTQQMLRGTVHASAGSGGVGTFVAEGAITFGSPALAGIQISALSGNKATKQFQAEIEISQFANKYLSQLDKVNVQLAEGKTHIAYDGTGLKLQTAITGHASYPKTGEQELSGDFKLEYEDEGGFAAKLENVEIKALDYFHSTGGHADLNEGTVSIGSDATFAIPDVATGTISTAHVNVRTGQFELAANVHVTAPMLAGVEINVSLNNTTIHADLVGAPAIPIGTWATLKPDPGTQITVTRGTGIVADLNGTVDAKTIGTGTFHVHYGAGAASGSVGVDVLPFAMFAATRVDMTIDEQRNVNTTGDIVLALAPEYTSAVDAEAHIAIANNEFTVSGNVTKIHGMGPLDAGFKGAEIKYVQASHTVTMDAGFDASEADAADFAPGSAMTVHFDSSARLLKVEGTLHPAKIGPVVFDGESHIHAVWTNQTKQLTVDGACHGTLPNVGSIEFTVDASLGHGPGHFGLQGKIDASLLNDKLAPLHFSSITSDFKLVLGGGASANAALSVRGALSSIDGVGPVTGAIEAHYETGKGLGGSITITEAKVGEVTLSGGIQFEDGKFQSGSLTAQANLPGLTIKGTVTVNAGASIADLSTTATLTVTPTEGSVLSRFITSGTLTAQLTKWKLTSVQGELNLVPPPLLSLSNTKITVGWTEGTGLHAELSADFPAPLAKNGELGHFVVGYARDKGLYATIDFPINVPGFENSAIVRGELNSSGLSLSATLQPKFPFIKSATVTAGYDFNQGFFIGGSIVVAPTESLELTISVRYIGGKLEIGGIDSAQKNEDAAEHQLAGFNYPFPTIPLATVGVASLGLKFTASGGAGYRMPKVKFANPQLIGGLDSLSSGQMPGFTFGGRVSMGAYISMALSVQIVGEIQLLIASCSAGIGAEIAARLNLELGADINGTYLPGQGAHIGINPFVSASLDLIASLICTLHASVCWFTVVDKKWTLASAQFAHIELGQFAPFNEIGVDIGGPQGTRLTNGISLREGWFNQIKQGVQEGATHAGDEEANKDAIDHVRPVLQAFKRAAPQFNELPAGWEQGMTAAPVNFKQMFPVDDKDWDFYQDHADQAETLDPADRMSSPSERLAKSVAITAKRDPAGAGRLILAWRRAQIANKGIDPDNGVNVVQERETVQAEINEKYQKDLLAAQEKQRQQDEEWQAHVQKQEADYAKAQQDHLKVGTTQKTTHDTQVKKVQAEFTDAQTKKTEAAKHAKQEGAIVDAKKEEKAPPPPPPAEPPPLKALAKPAPIPKPAPVPLPAPAEQLPAVTLPALPAEPGGMATAAAAIPPAERPVTPTSPGAKQAPQGAAPDPAPGAPSSAQQAGGGGGGAPMPGGGSSSGGKASGGGVTGSAPPPGPAVAAGPDGIISQHKTLDAKKAQVEGKAPGGGAKPGFLGGLFGGLFGGGAKAPAANANAPAGAAPAGPAPAGAAPAGGDKAPSANAAGGAGALDPTVQAVVDQGKTEENSQKQTLQQQEQQLDQKVKTEDQKAAEETKQLDKDAEEAKKKKEEEAKAKAAAEAKADADKKAAAEKKAGGAPGDKDKKPKGPIGTKVALDILGEAHTQFVNDAGVPMVASDPEPVTAALDKFGQEINAQPTIKPLGTADLASAKAQATKLAATAAKAASGDDVAAQSVANEQQALAAPLKTTWQWDKVVHEPAVTGGSLEDPLKHPYYPTFKGRVATLASKGHITIDGTPFAESTWHKICKAVKAANTAMTNPAAYSDFAKGWLNMKSPEFQKAIREFDIIGNELAKAASGQFERAKTFGFWSKDEGRTLAEAISELSLETSAIGTLMDGLPTLDGKKAGWDPEIWGALSHAYASAVVPEVVKGKKVYVCVGAGVPAGNIWDAVESVALSKGLEKAGISLESVTTYFAAAAKSKKDRKTLDLTKTTGGHPGCVFAGDRGGAIAAANAYFASLPDHVEPAKPPTGGPGTPPAPGTDKPKGPIGSRVPLDVNGASHTLYVDPAGTPTVASTPTPLSGKLAELDGSLATAPDDIKKLAAASKQQAHAVAPKLTDLATKAVGGDASANTTLIAQQEALATPLKTTWAWDEVKKHPAVTGGSIEDPHKHPYYETFKGRVATLATKGHITVDGTPFAEATWAKICKAVKAANSAMTNPAAYSNFAEGWLNMKSPEFQKAIREFDIIGAELAKAASGQFARAKTFGFWSKDEGRVLAESITDVSLETSAVGTLMDGLPTLDGKKAGWDPEIWGALSHAYATAIVPEIVKGKKVYVCVGGEVAAGNIWEAVESVALSKGLEKVGISLDSVTTYFAAAAKSRKERKTLDLAKTGGGYPGSLYKGDRGGALAAANAHFKALPEEPKKDDPKKAADPKAPGAAVDPKAPKGAAVPPPIPADAAKKPAKSEDEQKLETFIVDEMQALRKDNFGGATVNTIAKLVTDLGAFQLGLDMKKAWVAAYPKNARVVEAKAFLKDSATALEDACHRDFELSVLAKTASPKSDPTTHRDLGKTKLRVKSWQDAFAKEPAVFAAGISTCKSALADIEKAQDKILKDRDVALAAAKAAIDAVDPAKPGDTIKNEIAKVQAWLDDLTVGTPAAAAGVTVAKKLKEEKIAEVAKKAADAKKPGTTTPATPATPTTTTSTAGPTAKPVDPTAKPADPAAAKTAPPAVDPKIAQAKADKEKRELQLELLGKQLELKMEQALGPFEGFNAAASIAIGAAGWLALLNPGVAIGVASIKLIAGFGMKYSKYKAMISSKALLKTLSDAQLNDLESMFSAELTNFKAAVNLVHQEATKAAQASAAAKATGGAAKHAGKSEAPAVPVDGVEIGANAVKLAGEHAVEAVGEHGLEIAEHATAILGPAVALFNFGKNIAEVHHLKHEVKDLTKELDELREKWPSGAGAAPKVTPPPPPPPSGLPSGPAPTFSPPVKPAPAAQPPAAAVAPTTQVTPTGAAPGTKTEDDKSKSKYGAGPAPAGWQSQVRATTPSDAVVGDDPGHTYHILKNNTVVATTIPTLLAPDSAVSKRAVLIKQPSEQAIIAACQRFEIAIGNHMVVVAQPQIKNLMDRVRGYLNAHKVGEFEMTAAKIEERLMLLGGDLSQQWAGRLPKKKDVIDKVLNNQGSIREAMGVFTTFYTKILEPDLLAPGKLPVDAMMKLMPQVEHLAGDEATRKAAAIEAFQQAKAAAAANVTKVMGVRGDANQVGELNETRSPQIQPTVPAEHNPIAGAAHKGDHQGVPTTDNRYPAVAPNATRETDAWWMHNLTVEEFTRLGGTLSETEKKLYNEGVYRKAMADRKATIVDAASHQKAMEEANLEAKKHVPWATGFMGYDLKWNSTNVVMKAFDELSVPVGAGVSGTTARTMAMLQAIGIDGVTGLKLCLGYLLPIQAHSFAEVRQSALAMGVGGYKPMRGSHNYNQAPLTGDVESMAEWVAFDKDYSPAAIGEVSAPNKVV